MSIIVGNRTLRQLLEYRAATTPDKPFVIYDDLEGGVTQLSYAEFATHLCRKDSKTCAAPPGSGKPLIGQQKLGIIKDAPTRVEWQV
jgi:hypothetical protein